MGSINYEKILEKLLKEYPHAIDKIAEVIKKADESEEIFVRISFEDIIKSKIWNAEEKAQLLRINGHNKCTHLMKFKEKDHDSYTEICDFIYCIKTNDFISFKALIKIIRDINHQFGLEETYLDIFKACISYCEDSEKSKYVKVVLDTLTEEELEKLIAPNFRAHSISSVHNESIMTYIIATKDLDLIKKYIRYIDNINLYINDAVATGDINIVKYFLELGADINYLSEEVIMNKLTPLKTAIAINDDKMVEFLVDNGADIGLEGDCEDFVNRLKNYGITINYIDHKELNRLTSKCENVQLLMLTREISPLEFACKIIGRHHVKNHYEFKFIGDVYYFNENLDYRENRKKIVDYIFNKLKDKSKINYTDLIKFSIVTMDVVKLNEYSKYAIDNNCELDFDSIFETFFINYADSNAEISKELITLINSKNNNDELYFKLYDSYISYRVRAHSMVVNEFLKDFFKILPSNMKQGLVPYCKDIKTLEILLNNGYDINEVDNDGNNILYHLLNRKFNLYESEMKLFEYLLDKVNLSNRNKEGKTALYYAIKEFDTSDEFFKTKVTVPVHPKGNVEIAITKLISKMTKEDILEDDIMQVLEDRLEGDLHQIWSPECIYQRHRDLFTALVDKGIDVSDKILSAVFEGIDEKDEIILNMTIDYDKTLEFIFTKLDRDTEILKIDFEKEYQDLINYIKDKDSTYNGFILKLIKFNKIILNLTEFYKNHIVKKFNSEKYMEYYKDKYNTIYKDFDKYLLLIFIHAIKKYGSDKLSEILDYVPNYDINYYAVQEKIDYSTWEYYTTISNYGGIDSKTGQEIYGIEHFAAKDIEFFEEEVWFTGGLMQFAYLIDDVDLVKELQNRGAELKLILEDEDHTWDYVNSHTMKDYLEQFIDLAEYSEFNDNEKDFYLSLINSDNSNK